METNKASAQRREIKFGPWLISSAQSHILGSDGPDRESFEGQLKLPKVPDMVFAENQLRLVIPACGGCGLVFNAVDSLKLVDPEHDLVKVAATEIWREARQDCEHINDVIKPFDWTFTTDYMGSILQGSCSSAISSLQVIPTTERINVELLKQHEPILFFDDVLLFEDELADNGSSRLNVKIRVMPSGFFILLRFYLRVDGRLIRINDTRLHYEVGKDYILREYSSKESAVQDLQVPLSTLTDANEVAQHLPVKLELFAKLMLPRAEDS